MKKSNVSEEFSRYYNIMNKKRDWRTIRRTIRIDNKEGQRVLRIKEIVPAGGGSIFVRMYQRSNVLHERQDDHMQFSVPILIGGRWVRCDRGRRLFPNDSNPEIDPANDLLKREGENLEDKWNFNFLSESPRPDGEWEWIPREVIVQSSLDGIGGEFGENENGDIADDDDDDDGDLQVVEPQQDSEDDSDGSPEIKRARMISVDHM